MTAGDLTAGGLTADAIAALPYRENVGVMLLNAAGAVFVGQRLDNRTPAWQMPQGGIDPGEDPRTAALRELHEETGVRPDLVEILAVSDDWITYDLPADLVAKLWQGRYRGQTQKWFLMRFCGSNKQVNIETSHPEFAAWKWVVVSELEENIVEFKKAVYRQVIKEFKSHF
jgi:putative (di)nucleoside polyphosphate hydrolase